MYFFTSANNEWTFMVLHGRTHYEARASIIHAASRKKAFCMYLRAHSHHDQRITLRSSLMSDLSGTSKSSFRHSSVTAFCVCRAYLFYVRENSTKHLFWRIEFISYLRAVNHNRLRAEFNFYSNNMSKLYNGSNNRGKRVQNL